MEKAWRGRAGRDHCGVSRGDGERSRDSNMIRAKLTLTSVGALGVWMEQEKDNVGLHFQYGEQATVRIFGQVGVGSQRALSLQSFK